MAEKYDAIEHKYWRKVWDHVYELCSGYPPPDVTIFPQQRSIRMDLLPGWRRPSRVSTRSPRTAMSSDCSDFSYALALLQRSITKFRPFRSGADLPDFLRICQLFLDEGVDLSSMHDCMFNSHHAWPLHVVDKLMEMSPHFRTTPWYDYIFKWGWEVVAGKRVNMTLQQKIAWLEVKKISFAPGIYHTAVTELGDRHDTMLMEWIGDKVSKNDPNFIHTNDYGNKTYYDQAHRKTISRTVCTGTKRQTRLEWDVVYVKMNHIDAINSELESAKKKYMEVYFPEPKVPAKPKTQVKIQSSMNRFEALQTEIEA